MNSMLQCLEAGGKMTTDKSNAGTWTGFSLGGEHRKNIKGILKKKTEEN